MPSLEGVLAQIPGYGGYLAARQMNEQQQMQNLQQAGLLVGLQKHLQEQAQAEQLRSAMASSGGDIEKALEASLRTGNIGAAHQLAPLVKLAQEKKSHEQTQQAMKDFNAVTEPSTVQPTGPQELGIGQPAGGADSTAAVGTEITAQRDARIAKLNKLAEIYATNPAVVTRIQAEIDRLQNIKPMVEHNFSVGDNMVQPHISLDQGRTWQPIPGSKPSAKFGKQVLSVEETANQPTADTIDMDAWRYLTDGTLPTNMGRGVQGAKQATMIRNRASELAKEMGVPMEEVRFANLTNKAQVQAIGQLGRARAQILQFEKTAEYNADLALNASKDVWRTGSPWINKPLQIIRSEGLGDPQTKVFNAANETFVSEYARVMSGGYGAAQTTEGAQQRAHTLLSTATAPQQYEAVIKQLKAEMNNRIRALNTQMDEERQRLRSGIGKPLVTPPVTSPAATPAAAPADYTEGQTATGPNGQKIIYKGGQWQPSQ